MILFNNYSNEYTIKLEYKHKVLFGNEVDINNISFIDLLGRTVLSINLSTEDVLRLICDLYAYTTFGSLYMDTDVSSNNSTMDYYTFHFEQANGNDYGDIFVIYHTIAYNNLKVPVLKIDLYEGISTENGIIELIYALHEEFLSDKYNMADLCPDFCCE